MWADQNTRDSEPQLEINDIQGDILVGLQKDFEWFVFFEITDVGKFKEFARRNVLPRISSAEQVLKWQLALDAQKAVGQTQKQQFVGVNLGFTRSGLDKLRVPGSIDDASFSDGLAKKSSSLNDPQDGPFVVDNWRFGGPRDCLHGVVLITGPDQDIVDRVMKELTDDAGSNGWNVTHKERGATRPNNRGREHFGFIDGISQPGIRGRIDAVLPDRKFLEPEPDPKSPGHQPGSNLVWPGEFVFGYPASALRSGATSDLDGPGKVATGGPAWARNGSLMVIRRLNQFVPEFNNLVQREAAESTTDPVLFGARIVGRWKSGAPLALAPIQDDHVLGASQSHNNNFDFESDSQGLRCPFAAHIRKAYPRSGDKYSHRLIRRGIPFGPEVTPKEIEDKKTQEELERGLMFVSYQTSIVEQFEALTTNQLNAPGPNKEGSDALVGRPSSSGARTVKGLLAGYPGGGDTTTSTTLPDFVRPSGGGYFFMPSLSTFKIMVETPKESTKRVYYKEEPLLFDQSNVNQVFSRLIDLFNAGDYDDMLPLLDPGISWKRLHHVDSIVGALNLVRWLRDNKASQNPQFSLDTSEKKKALLSDGGAQISGSAKWQSRKGASDERIDYCFTFAQGDRGWLLVNAFAALR